ncbi:hypothetical protein DMI62_10040 [Escherichia coli]|nr:hypothetical protein [Escherichia coli]
MVNLGNSKDWDALVKRANAGKLDGVNVITPGECGIAG